MAHHPALEGAPNFRDIGGCTGRDGRRVRRGLIYRSQGLHRLTPRDLEVIRQLGIHTICDLRSHPEQHDHPSRWPTDAIVQRLDLNVRADLRAHNQELLNILRERPDPEGARATMLHCYRLFPKSLAAPLQRIFAALLDPGEGMPALVHCSAGKDRTGFVIAMILSAVGVDRHAIYRDYMATLDMIDLPDLMATTDAAMKAMLGETLAPESLEVVARVSPDYLDAAMAEIEAQHGSVAAYLETVCGLDGESRQALEALLLE